MKFLSSLPSLVGQGVSVLLCAGGWDVCSQAHGFSDWTCIHSQIVFLSHAVVYQACVGFVVSGKLVLEIAALLWIRAMTTVRLRRLDLRLD